MKFSGLLKKIVALVLPPSHEDEGRSFLIRMSYYSFLTVFITTFYFAATLNASSALIGKIMCSIVTVCMFGSLVIIKMGHFKFAGGMSLSVAYFCIISSSILNEGVSSVPMQAIPAAFLLILTFMRLRGLFAFGALTIVSIYWMMRLDQAGFYAEGHGPIIVETPGIVSAGILTATCMVIYIVVKNSINSNQGLIEAKMMAEEQNRLKNKYFATMTHELRTPLNAIIGYSEDIIDIDAEQNQMVDREVMDDVHRIRESGKYLLSLINDILDISKIEADGMDVYINQFSGLELINEIYATVYPIAKQNGNVIVSGLEFDQRISTDRQKLRQILINLVSNSAKYTQDGEICLKFSLLDEGAYQFEVTDTGIGIPAEEIPKLFDSYSQATNSSSSFKGTGLGLAITKKLTDVLQGDLTVESEVNVGTTFTLTLPNLSPEFVDVPIFGEMVEA